MVDPITGTDWQPDELDVIVADYFDMLAADVAGTPYVKSRHRAALVSRLGRSDGSIEFKHQKLSESSSDAKDQDDADTILE